MALILSAAGRFSIPVSSDEMVLYRNVLRKECGKSVPTRRNNKANCSLALSVQVANAWRNTEVGSGTTITPHQ